MRKSKAETAETRKRIVSVASGVFPRRGLAGAAVEDVMTAAGLTLGGFYRHFESKEQLIAEASAAAFQEFARISERAADGLPPREALNTMVAVYLSQLGAEEAVVLCPLANLGSELRHADQQIRDVADAGYQRMVQRFASKLEVLGVADSVHLAESIVATIVGAVSLAQLVADDAAAKAILDNAQTTVDSLVSFSV